MAEAPLNVELLTELFARLASGDRSALHETFRILYPLIRRFCEKALGAGADAEDATQQILEKVFEQIGSYDTSRSALPWVFAIASWEVRTVRRRNWRGQQRASDLVADELISEHGDPETAAMSTQFFATIDELIETLPVQDRQTMREAVERELAPVATLPADASFRKRKQRALDKLRALLRNLGHVQ